MGRGKKKPIFSRRVASAEFLAGLILALFGWFVIYESENLTLGRLRSPSAGFFPLLLGSLVTVFVLILLAGILLGKVELKREQWDKINWHKVVLSFIALLVYSLTLETIGIFASNLPFFCISLIPNREKGHCADPGNFGCDLRGVLRRVQTYPLHSTP
jgi:hypothetical protein